jgi:hypothetical protein
MSSTDIRSILDRLSTVEEGKLTPVNVKHGLNKQQKSVDQLPALFKPKNISPTLTKKPYQKHPMDGKLVGDSIEPTKSPLEEAMQEVEEDMLGKIKGDFISYLDKLEKKIRRDDDLRDRETPNLDKLEKKQSLDRDLVDKARSAVERGEAEEDMYEDPTQQELSVETPPAPVQNPTLPESMPVQTVALEDSVVFEIHGDDNSGFEIRHSGRSLPTRFSDIDQANTALKLFQRRRAQRDRGQDYIEEK